MGYIIQKIDVDTDKKYFVGDINKIKDIVTHGDLRYMFYTDDINEAEVFNDKKTFKVIDRTHNLTRRKFVDGSPVFYRAYNILVIPVDKNK